MNKLKNRNLCWCVGVILVVVTQGLQGQGISHSDVFFVYNEGQIQITPQSGSLVIPQIMPDSGFFAQANANPGFFSEQDIGGGTSPNDVIAYNVLSDLLLWSEGAFTAPKESTEIRILNNPGSVEDTVIGFASGEQPADFAPLTNSIGQSSASGDFHAHVDFRLEPLTDDPDESPLFGAYGIKMSLSTDNSNVAESDPFFVVFQFGMEEDAFLEALDDFDELLAPPNSLLGDFNDDGILSALDLDLLSAEVRDGGNAASFDLTDDNLVNGSDRTHWVETVADTFFGDANLDGTVAFPDFLALATGFSQPGGWAEGDFDGDGQVLFPDFLSLATNFGKSRTLAASVPEPNTAPIVLFMAFLLARHFTLLNEPRKGKR